MKDEAIKHIISRCNLNEIVDILSDKLSGSELNSLLLEVFDRRTTKETPSSLLSKYSKNKLAKPAQLDFLEFKEEELECCKIIANNNYELIELSPVAQLGTSSVMATVSQKKVRVDDYEDIIGYLMLVKPYFPVFWLSPLRTLF